MKLIDNAGIWHRLWSLRLAVLAAVLAAMEAVLPLWEKVLPVGTFAIAASIVGILGAASRVIKQELPDDRRQ